VSDTTWENIEKQTKENYSREIIRKQKRTITTERLLEK
jgi:hypothetical protein